MRRHRRRLAPWMLGFFCPCALLGQKPLTWDDVRDRFQKNNPRLLAGELLTNESQADEVTAGLRPNPTFSSINDEFLFFNPGRFKPFDTSQWTESVSQLIERRRKRPLRIQSARLATSIAGTDQLDLERQMMFDLRDVFVKTLQAKALLGVARENLDYYDKILDVNRLRFKAGDISQVDLTRLELQRAQFESDLVNAGVTLRTSKISLLQMVNERQPAAGFDVTGPFNYQPLNMTLEEARQAALETRPDLRSAVTAIARAQADHRLAIANGSADPELSLEYQRNQTDNTMGFGFTIPLRIFDRNQGEKAKTQIEITRAQRNRQAVLSGILRDVDAAYATLTSVRDLVIPYRDRYIPEARDIRETVSFSYSHGGASLLDFLDAQKSYRDTELAFQGLVADYLFALNQLSQSVGKEILP